MIPAFSIVCSALAVSLAGDEDVMLHRGRWRPAAIAVPDEWTPPGLRHKREFAIENRVEKAHLRLRFPAPDAYRLRIFYVLEGDAPVKIWIGGRRAGWLQPGRGWQEGFARTPYVQKNEELSLTFGLAEGARLTLRRVDYRNYLFRLGRGFLLKPVGANRARVGVLPPTLAAGGLILLWFSAAWVFRSQGRVKTASGDFLLPVGILSLGYLALHSATPYAVHSKPEILLTAILSLAAASLGLRLLPPVDGRVAVKRLGLAAGGIAVAAFLAEATLWVWDPPMSRPRVGSYARYSPVYGWLNRPGVSGWQVDIGYHIRINRYGHRGPEYPIKNPPGVFRILGLGDSFTFGWGVEEEQTFLRVLERRLRAAGHNVEVLNAAVPAWHSTQSLLYLLNEGRRFEPDLVIAAFFHDDVRAHSFEEIFQGETALNLKKAESEVAQRKRSGLSRKIRIYNFWFNWRKIQAASRKYRRSNPYPTFEKEREIFRPDFDEDESKAAALEKMLGEWDKARKRLAVPILFTYIPMGGALHFPELQGDARTLARLAREKRFPYFDLISQLERHPAPRTLYLHPRDGHMSAVGHSVFGEALAKWLLESGELKR